MRRRKRPIYEIFKDELVNNELLFEGMKESEALIKLWAVRQKKKLWGFSLTF